MIKFKDIRSKVSKIFTENQQMKIVLFISSVFWFFRKYFLGVDIKHQNEFLDNWNLIKSGSSLDKERSFTLYQLINLHNNFFKGIKTNLIEFGVSRGSSVSTICKFCKEDSEIFGVDSFGYFAKQIQEKSIGNYDKNYHDKSLAFSLEDRFKDFEVQNLYNKITSDKNFKNKKLTFIKCHFPTTLENKDRELLENTKFSFCYIDFDLYQSTIDVLSFIFDKLEKNAIVLIDDYNFINQEGCKIAVDEFGLDLNKCIQTKSGQLIYFNV